MSNSDLNTNKNVLYFGTRDGAVAKSKRLIFAGFWPKVKYDQEQGQYYVEWANEPYTQKKKV